VRAEIRYHSRRGKSGVMQVIIYQPRMPEEECAEILAAVGITPEVKGWPRFVSQTKDTYSRDQAEVLVAYLNSRQATSAHMREAGLPLPGIVGASAIPTLPSFRDGIVYRLYTEKGYNLAFDVEAINVKTYLYMTRLFNEFESALDGE